MSTPTPRTDAVYLEHRYWANEDEATEAIEDLRDLARELERELAKAKAILASIEEDGTEEHNAAVRLRQELAAERQKVRVLRDACESICEEWGDNYNTNPIGAGLRMATRAGKVLEAMEGAE